MKKIGILGSGIVAKSLAKGFLNENYTCALGTSSPEKLIEWNNQLPHKAEIMSMQDCAAFGDILVLAIKGDAAESFIKSLDKNSLKNKLIIDTSNPIDHTRAPQNGVLPFFTDLNLSLMERLQAIAPEAHFVKAFNSIGNAFMYKPNFNGQQATMFYCGNNDEAKKECAEILIQFGWDICDMGKAEAARAIEPLCMLWCIPGFLRNEWNHGFGLVKK